MNVRDVRVVEGGEHLRFAAEAREPIRIARDGRDQNLDGHVAIELRVAGAIDLAHAAGAEQRDDVIGAELRAGIERHWKNSGGLYAARRWRRDERNPLLLVAAVNRKILTIDGDDCVPRIEFAHADQAEIR